MSSIVSVQYLHLHRFPIEICGTMNKFFEFVVAVFRFFSTRFAVDCLPYLYTCVGMDIVYGGTY